MLKKLSQDIRIGRYFLMFLFLAANEIDSTESTQIEGSRLTSNHLSFNKIEGKKNDEQYQINSDFVKRHAPKELQHPPRVFKCCQNDFVFDFDSKKCIDPISKDSFSKMIRQFKRNIQISSIIRNEKAASFEVSDTLRNNLTIHTAGGNIDYRKSFVEIVGYGFPKLSFDSHHVTLLNAQNISEKAEKSLSESNMYQYVLDPDKMTPMQDLRGNGRYPYPVRVVSTAPLQVLDDFEEYNEYCLDVAFSSIGQYLGTVAVVKQIKPEIECRSRPCLRSCCKQGNVYDENGKFNTNKDGYCRKLDTLNEPNIRKAAIWQPTLATSYKSSGEILSTDNFFQDYKYFYGKPDCNTELVVIDEKLGEHYFFHEDGNLDFKGQRFNYTQYCVATLEATSSNMRNISSNNSTDLGSLENYFYREAYICIPKRIDPEVTMILEFARRAMPIMYGISLVFLFFAFIYVYIKNRDRLFGVMTLCLLGMLAGFYVCILTPHLAGASQINDSPILCQIEGFCIQFFYISAMFWLNSMCLDIWRTFRRIRMRTQAMKSISSDMKIQKGQGWQHPRFKYYALWSWGGPAIISGITALMQYLPSHLTEGYQVPEIGRCTCVFGQEGAVYYMHIVIAPMLLLNLLLFAFSTWSLCCGIWSAGKNRGVLKARNNQNRAPTVTKMFFVLGMTWIAEVISFLLNYGFAYDNGVDCPSVPTNAMIIKASFLFDCINAVQGVILFCVLFFDASTLRRIRSCLKPISSKKKRIPLKLMSSSIGTKVDEKQIDDKEVTFDHHERQLTIRTNRTWRTPSPQPTSSGISQPVMTQVEVTEEFCSRNGAAIDASEEIGRALEVTKFALTRQSVGSFDGCPDCNKHKKDGPDSQVPTADFSMQFP